MKQDKDAFFSHSTRSLRAIRHEQEIISIQIGKEGVKLSLFSDDIVLYVKNSKHCTQKQRISNQYKKISFYMFTMNNPKRKLRKQLNFQ